MRLTTSPRLIASDIDGTLITTAGRVTERLRAAVTEWVRRGNYFALVTGRPQRWIRPVLEQVPVNAPCITSNGAAVVDTADGRLVRTHELSPATLRSVVSAARDALVDDGGVAVAAERIGQHPRALGAGDYAVTEDFASTWVESDISVVSEEDLLAQPALKLLLRNDGLNTRVMHALVSRAVDPQIAHVTYSMDIGLLEVSLPGVNKGSALRELAAELGIAQEDTVAFGDMVNDIEMLRWAGLGVAMGNAFDEVKAAADVVTAGNDEWGEALIIERLLAGEDLSAGHR